MDDQWEEDDWNDDEIDEEESVSCPECGAEVYLVADKCKACGYWLSEADRYAMSSGMSQTNSMKFVGKVILVFILVALMSGFLLF